MASPRQTTPGKPPDNRQPVKKTGGASRKSKETRFKDRAELLDFMLEVSRVTSETIDLDLLLGNVASMVHEVVPADLLAIMLYSEKARGLKIRFSLGHRDELVKNLVVRLGEGITGAAAANQIPILVDDVRNDPRYIAAYDFVRSELAIPMVARKKLVGVIDLQSTKPRAYTDQDRAVLRLLASRVASSIDNARLHRRVDRQNRTLRILANISREFSSILNLDELLTKVAETLRALISFDAFTVFLVDDERKVLRARFSLRYDQRVTLDSIPLGKGITGSSVMQRQPVLVMDTLQDPRYIASHPEIRSEVAVPLVVQDRIVGVLDLESERLAYFTEDHVRMLTLLAPQVASSVENARLYEQLQQRERSMEEDLRAARKLQRVLMPPRAPKLRRLDIFVKARAAREISGDVYDFFEDGDRYAVLAFGDVSGKGAAAALYGALMNGLLRTLAPRKRSPALLMQALNDALLERKVDAHYVSMLLMLWDADMRRFTVANAGSTPPLICRNGELIRPRVEGVPVGLLDGPAYEEVTIDPQPGDVILLYSDGIQDQQGASNNEEYGLTQLPNALRAHYPLSARKIAEGIFADLDRFMGPERVFDDQTLIAIKVLE